MAEFVGKKRNKSLRFCEFLISINILIFLLMCFRYYLGRKPVVVVADPDMLRQVMVKDFSSFPNRMVSLFFYCDFRRFSSNGCVVSACSLHRVCASSPSPWATVCSCWGMNAGREWGASWLRRSVLPRWRRSGTNFPPESVLLKSDITFFIGEWSVVEWAWPPRWEGLNY